MMSSNPPRIRVGLVDDHAAMLRGIRDYVRENAPDLEIVWTASDPGQLEEYFARTVPDLFVVDLALSGGPYVAAISNPATSGLPWIRRVKAQWPQVVIIVYTAYSDFYPEAVAAGAAGFVEKGPDVEPLVHALRSAFHGAHVAYPADLPRRTVPGATEEEITQADLDQIGLSRVLARPAEQMRRKYGLKKRALLAGLLRVQADSPTIESIGESLGYSGHTVDGDMRDLYEQLEVEPHTLIALLHKFHEERVV